MDDGDFWTFCFPRTRVREKRKEALIKQPSSNFFSLIFHSLLFRSPAAMAAFLVKCATIWTLISVIFALDEYPLLMPKIHPEAAESYLCTPILLDNEEPNFIVG